MRTDPSIKEPAPPATRSWDNSTLRNRLEEQLTSGAPVEALHRLARDRDTTVKMHAKSRWFRRR